MPNNNNHQIRLTGKSEIDNPLDDTKDASLCFERVAVRKTERLNNEDGTYTYVYNLGNLGKITIITEDKIITGKTKKQSQRLRNALYYVSKDRDEDAEEFYEKFMNLLLVPENLEKVVDLLVN